MKWLYIIQIEMKLFQFPKMNKAVWSYPKLNKDVLLVQIWMELSLFGQSWFSLLEFTQIFPIYGNIFNFTQIWMK